MIQTKTKPFVLSQLSYKQDALAPFISSETVSYHYNKHHQGYVTKLNELIEGSEYEEFELEKVIIKSAGQPELADIFNNAAQVWNHDFYWSSLSPSGGGKPSGELAKKIDAGFGGYDEFLKQFIEMGTTHFGSGWVWLVNDGGVLKITRTSNANNPLSQKIGKALLVLDVWEHAYYLDHQNQRNQHLKTVMDKLINWRFAEKNLAEGGDTSKDE